MMKTIAQVLSRHPYAVTSLAFLGIVAVGWRVLGWGERQLGFALLLYFIVALGVRLDEISRSIGAGSGSPYPHPPDPDTVVAHLKDIKELLRRIESKLPPPDRPSS